jgi:hypothetical protein
LIFWCCRARHAYRPAHDRQTVSFKIFTESLP